MSDRPAGLSGVFAGRYAIERELGRGGSAIVYLAHDQQRGHQVAIKMLRPELLESVAADRFLKEIRLNQRLHHPQILPVLDSGSHEGQLYFVLPHMEAGTLRTRLEREKQLPVQDAIAITRSIAIALAHAHESGLVHRDVKPENILFTSGVACLGDFGIARALERSMGESTTSTSLVRGTPPYMSPEQASGEQSYDGRSDIYSLGCVLYEMLAGIQPFVGPTPQSVIAQRLTHPPRPLRVYRPALSAALETVVARALMVTPADRYQTALEFSDALETASRTADAPPSDASGAVRRRRLIGIALGIAVALAIAAAAIRMLTTRAAGSVISGIPEGDPRRIAVLYLENLTPAIIPAYVADGIAEDLIDRFSAVRALHVISPIGVRRFRGSAIPADSLARALKVGTIIAGSIARSGNTLRINIRLIDGRSGQQLYSQSLEQQWTELFALQDKLAEELAFVLRQRLGDQIALRRHLAATKSVAAWETVQLASATVRRAVEASSLRSDPEAPRLFLAADSLYARAEQLDRSWIYPVIRRGRVALALEFRSPLSPALVDSIAYRRLTPPERRVLWIRHAMQFADSALRRAPGSPDALALRGEARYALITTGIAGVDSLMPPAERDLRLALDARPDLATAWSSLAQLSLLQGRFADGAAAAQRAFDADAFFEERRIVSIAFFASLYAEQVDDARRWCRLGLMHYAGDPRFTECELTLLGWTGHSRDDVAAAWRVVTLIEQRDTLRLLAQTWGYRRLMVAAVLAREGMSDSARSVLRAVQAQLPADPTANGSALPEAYVRLLLNDRDGALALLAGNLKNQPQSRALIAKFPWFRALQDDPRFERLVRPAQPEAPAAKG